MLGDLMAHLFEGIETRYKKELDVIRAQYPFEDFKCKTPIVKYHFKEVV